MEQRLTMKKDCRFTVSRIVEMVQEGAAHGEEAAGEKELCSSAAQYLLVMMPSSFDHEGAYY
jgi:hypothetical protein